MLCVLMPGSALLIPVHGMTVNHCSTVRKHVKMETQDVCCDEDDDSENN